MLNLPERIVFAVNPKRAGGIRVNIDSGKIMEYIFGAPTKINLVTTLLEKNGKLYFSSLKNPTILILSEEHAKSSEEGPKEEEL